MIFPYRGLFFSELTQIYLLYLALTRFPYYEPTGPVPWIFQVMDILTWRASKGAHMYQDLCVRYMSLTWTNLILCSLRISLDFQDCFIIFPCLSFQVIVLLLKVKPLIATHYLVNMPHPPNNSLQIVPERIE